MRVFAILVSVLFCLTDISVFSAVLSSKKDPGIIRIGVVSFTERTASLRRWRATANYLSAHFSEHNFVLESYSSREFNKASRVKLGQNDLFIVSPVEFFILQEKIRVVPLATMKKKHVNYVLDTLSGVVVAHAERDDINNFIDIDGRRVAAVDPLSMAGWIAQLRECKQAGVQLSPESSQVTFSGSGEKVLRALDKGKVDVGFIPSGLLERMAKDGKIKLENYKVLPKPFARQLYPLLHSTAIYPEKLIVLNPESVSNEIKEKLLKLLLTLQPTDYATVAGDYSGWSVPCNYYGVKKCLKAVDIIENSNIHSLNSFIYAFRYPLLILAAALFLAALSYYRRMQTLSQGKDRYLRRQAELIKEQLMIQTELDYAKDEESTILENISDGVIYVDRKRRIVWTNGVAASYLGKQPKDLLGKVSHNLWRSKSKSRKPCVIETAITTRRHADTVLHMSDGRTFEIGAEPVFDKKNEVKGVVETFKDVTQRKKTEEKLREGQRLYELTLNAINEGLYDYDCKNDVFTYSSQLLEILDCHNGELSRSIEGWKKLIHPDDVDKIISFQSSGRFSFSVRMKNKTGNWVWMLCRGMCVELDPAGQPERIVGTVTNIQQRKVAEEMLKREKERLALILKSSGLGFWTWDFDKKTIELDENWMLMTGYEFSDNNVSEDFLKSNIHAEDIDDFNGCIQELNIAGNEDYNCSFRLKHKSNRWIWLHGVGKVIKRGSEGNPLIMVGMHQDISEQIQREQAIAIESKARKEPKKRKPQNAGKKAAKATPKYQPPVSADSNNRPLVLVVEDNDVNLLLLKALLKKLDIATVSAENGQEALEALEAGVFNFILMDCQMPVMDGYEATRRIRKSNEPWANIPIIAMTANAMVGDEEKCFEAGMDDYLSKPVDFNLLKKITAKYQ